MADYQKAPAAARDALEKYWNGDEMSGIGGAVDDLLAAIDAQKPVAWVPVVGFEGVYEVSSAGLVRRIDSGKILSTAAKAGDGYVKCDLYKSGARTQTYLHRVVCEAFHGPANGRQVNHKDGDKENNAASNLEWVSSSENVNHSYYVLGNNVSPVEAYDHSHGQEALSFESVEQAVRSGFDSAHIYRCINNANKRHGGYRWRFTKAAPPAAVVQSVREELQQMCVDMGAYWRASDAHGVKLTPAQAEEVLRHALLVEVEVEQTPPAPAVPSLWIRGDFLRGTDAAHVADRWRSEGHRVTAYAKVADAKGKGE